MNIAAAQRSDVRPSPWDPDSRHFPLALSAHVRRDERRLHDRALEAAADHEEAKLEDGVRLVHRSLADLLAKEGLSEIETDGKFDPHVHEALLSQPSDAEEGSVIEVVQKGYKLGDKVLRPARVVVAAPPVHEA